MVSAYRCSLTRGRVKLCQKSRENDAKRLMGKSSLPSFFASEGKNKNKKEKEKKERKRKKEQDLYESVTGKQHHPDLFSRFIAICAVTTNVYLGNRR